MRAIAIGVARANPIMIRNNEAKPVDWPRFLGTNVDGVAPATQLDFNWTSKPPRLVWSLPVGEGYGIPTKAMNDAVMMLARLEGLLFDPVYSGKGLAGMIDLVGNGYFAGAQNIVFVHTGGVAGLFGYSDKLVTDK